MAVSRTQPYTLVELSCGSVASNLHLRGMINETQEEDKSDERSLIKTGNTQLLQEDQDRTDGDPAILEEFKLLDVMTKKPNSD